MQATWWHGRPLVNVFLGTTPRGWQVCSRKSIIDWSNYSDRKHEFWDPKWWWLSKGNGTPFFWGKSGLVKYYNLARSLIGVELSVERVALQIDVYIMYIQGLGPYTIACIFWALEFFLMIMTTRCIWSFFSASFGKPEPWYLVKAWSVINQVAFGSYLVTWFSGNLLWTNTPLNTPNSSSNDGWMCILKTDYTQFFLIFLLSFPQSISAAFPQQSSDAGDASTALWLQYGLDLPERKAVFLAADLDTWRKFVPWFQRCFWKTRRKKSDG